MCWTQCQEELRGLCLKWKPDRWAGIEALSQIISRQKKKILFFLELITPLDNCVRGVLLILPVFIFGFPGLENIIRNDEEEVMFSVSLGNLRYLIKRLLFLINFGSYYLKSFK